MVDLTPAPASDHSEADHSSSSMDFTTLWLLGMLVLLPVKFISFPHNMELVDFWILAALIIFWISFVLGRQSIIVNPYFVAIWLIVVGSLVSTFAARNVSYSLVVLLKEVYLLALFVTLIVMLSRLSAQNLRLVMLAWLVTVMLHGLLILAQFSSPDLWRFVTGLGGQSVDIDHFRPSGLFISEKAGDANKAAFYQLLGFVPLVLTSRSKCFAMILGVVLFSSILATGSMGATVAFTTGLIVALFAILVVSKDLAPITKNLIPLIVASSFLGALLIFVFNHNDLSHLEGIVVGRAERSAGGRLDLWQRGLGVLLDNDATLITGIGPENFRVVDGKGNQLHNDLLAFVVERGLLGGLGLMALGGIAVCRAAYMLRIYATCLQGGGLKLIVFLATMIAILVESLTHQVFHTRELWLVLALQEAFLFRLASSR